METILRKELEHEESELAGTKNQSSWRKFVGLQSVSIEEKYRQQCVKELEKVLMSRQQLDQTTKTNQVVGIYLLLFLWKKCSYFSFVLILIPMN